MFFLKFLHFKPTKSQPLVTYRAAPSSPDPFSVSFWYLLILLHAFFGMWLPEVVLEMYLEEGLR